MIRRSLLVLPALVLLGACVPDDPLRTSYGGGGYGGPSYAQSAGYYLGGGGGGPYGGRYAGSPYGGTGYTGGSVYGGRSYGGYRRSYDAAYRDGYYDRPGGWQAARQAREAYRRQTQDPNYVDPQNPPGP
jgi:hypothetical protein